MDAEQKYLRAELDKIAHGLDIENIVIVAHDEKDGKDMMYVSSRSMDELLTVTLLIRAATMRLKTSGLHPAKINKYVNMVVRQELEE